MSPSRAASPVSGKSPGIFSGGYAFALAAVLLANTLRNIATQFPHQLSDETAFLLSSKYFLQWDLVRSLGYMPVPGLVYLKIGSFLASSDQYYLLAKVWNALCLTLAAIPAFFVAHRVMSATEAKVASVLVAVIPSTIYGAYFTPEAVYILVFWIFAAVAVAALNEPRRYRIALAAGALCALEYLIKPHAVALAAAYLAAVIALGLAAYFGRSATASAEGRWRSRRTMLAHVGSFAAGAIATSVALGRIIGGGWLAAFDLKLYSELIARGTDIGWNLERIGSIARLLLLHAAAIAAACAIPLGFIVALSVRRRPAGRSSLALSVFSVAVVSMLVLMTAKASVDFHAIYGGSNTLDRLHVRYYSFALPLLILIVVGRFRELSPVDTPIRAKLAAALLAIAVVACIVITQRQTFTFLDAPDLAYLVYGTTTRVAVVIGTLAAVAVALSAKGPRWLILAGWGVMSLLNVYACTRFQQSEDREQTGDRAVSVIRGLFEGRDRDDGIIVAGSYPVAAARAAFRLASTSPVVPTVRDARARTSPSTKWILVLGDPARGAFESPAIRAGDSAVYLIDRSRVGQFPDTGLRKAIYSFRASATSRAIARPAQAAEAWGTWLSGPEAEVVFPVPLPERGSIVLSVAVLDPKLQGRPNVVICEKSFPLDATDKLGEHRLEYACPVAPDRIRFSGLKPLSPRDLGLSADPRALALAIESIEVERADR